MFLGDPAQRARFLRVGYRQNRFPRAPFGGACGVLDPAGPGIVRTFPRSTGSSKRGVGYAIRLPAKRVLQEKIGYLLKRPVGRPLHEVRRFYASFPLSGAELERAEARRH